jgi:hypothetical protein
MIRSEKFKSVPSKIINKTAITLSLFTILILSIFINPEKANFLICYFQELTGHTCPTCGLSHSFYAVSHLHLMESFKFHLMGPIIFLIILFFLLKFLLEISTQKNLKIRLNPNIIKITLLVFSFSWLSFWIIRLVNDL